MYGATLERRADKRSVEGTSFAGSSVVAYRAKVRTIPSRWRHRCGCASCGRLAHISASSARPDSGRGRLVQGASNARGRSIKRTLQRRYRVHQELPVGSAQCQLWGVGSAEPVRGGRRPAPAGKESDACTRRAPRRMGGGTERRIVDAKRGRSPCQPRPGRMAKTRRITAKREVVGRRGDWRLRP